MIAPLTLLHSEWPKLHRVLAILSAKRLKRNTKGNNMSEKTSAACKEVQVPLSMHVWVLNLQKYCLKQRYFDHFELFRD